VESLCASQAAQAETVIQSIVMRQQFLHQDYSTHLGTLRKTLTSLPSE